MLYEIGDKVLDEWVITRTIGEGSYGKVVEIERNEFGLSMKSALKIISTLEITAIKSRYGRGSR